MSRTPMALSALYSLLDVAVFSTIAWIVLPTLLRDGGAPQWSKILGSLLLGVLIVGKVSRWILSAFGSESLAFTADRAAIVRSSPLGRRRAEAALNGEVLWIRPTTVGLIAYLYRDSKSMTTFQAGALVVRRADADDAVWEPWEHVLPGEARALWLALHGGTDVRDLIVRDGAIAKRDARENQLSHGSI